MPIVGTAGHVDHGKSTLIRALTGRDPDRLAEEKARGLTIDLGFAWMNLPSGATIGFVDVPGHERFIKNMLAGIDAVNVGLLVVAADEGWMPQTEEHLAVLDLLEVRSIVVALTRTGLADAETRELAEAEIEEHVAGTVAEGAPVAAVDSITGEGLDRLIDELEAAVAGAVVPDLGRPRLWVDRAFSIAGAGTVVTGTLLDGAVALGDEVAIYPGGETTRVRGLQSHERSVERVEPGSRTALNLGGVGTGGVGRGSMIGRPGEWVPTTRFLATLRTVRGLAAPLQDRGAFHLHVGSGSWPVRMRLLDGPELAGAGHAIVTLEVPVPLAVGDRFIVREVGRRAVVAGGRVTDPRPPNRVRGLDLAALDRLAGLDPDEQATGLLASRRIDQADVLAAHTRGGVAGAALVSGRTVVDPGEGARLETEAARIVEQFHADNPLRAGVPKASLASSLGVEGGLVDLLIGRSEALTEDGSDVALANFRVALDGDARAAWDRARRALVAGPAVPTIAELGLSTELLYALVRDGSLVRVGQDLAYLPEQLDELVAGLNGLPDQFTVAEFRDHVGLTRKYAVPLLEWMDAAGHTMRRGDVRSVRAS
ncbi:MAG: selenocysteine-specific translation elongation factor [Acidimicrobiia bacterium]|nr:selenocysteine-specific translation elongation factor [Acidimicrobiia bacterium]